MEVRDNTFVIKLIEKNEEGGRVSVKTLIKTLDTLQKAVYDIGSVLIDRDPSTPGRTPAPVEKVCELYLIKADPGSLTATVSFPQRRMDLVPGIPDATDRVANNFKNIVRGIMRNDDTLIKNTIQNQKYRRKVISEINSILPTNTSDYEMYFDFEDKGFERIERPDEENLKELIGECTEEEIRPTFQELEAKVHCRIFVDDSGKIRDFGEVYDFETLEDIRPHKVQSLYWNGEVFNLDKEIICEVKKEEGYYLIEYEPLGIIAYAKTREEAIKEFNEEFSMIYHAYGQEDESNLTQDAIDLKNTINSIVGSVQFKIGG
ncbi:MAG: hypothetical protein ACM3TR_06575 [Caulobacteraceae bacterium]